MYSYDRTAVLFTGKPPYQAPKKTVTELRQDTAELRGALEKLRREAAQAKSPLTQEISGAIRNCGAILEVLNKLEEA